MATLPGSIERRFRSHTAEPRNPPFERTSLKRRSPALRLEPQKLVKFFSSRVESRNAIFYSEAGGPKNCHVSGILVLRVIPFIGHYYYSLTRLTVSLIYRLSDNPCSLLPVYQ